MKLQMGKAYNYFTKESPDQSTQVTVVVSDIWELFGIQRVTFRKLHSNPYDGIYGNLPYTFDRWIFFGNVPSNIKET